MADDQETPAAKPKRERLTIEQKIAKLEQQAQRLRALKHKRSRQIETREKIIIGGAVVKAMRSNGEWRSRVCALLRDDVTRPIDREVIAEWLSATFTPD